MGHQSSPPAIPYRHEIIAHFCGHQMVLHTNHNVLKVQWGDVATATGILRLKRLRSVLLVEFVQELSELGIIEGPPFLLPEIPLHKVSVQLQWELSKQIGFLNHRHEIIWKKKAKC